MLTQLRTPLALACLLAIACSGGDDREDLEALHTRWVATYDQLTAPIDGLVPPRRPAIFTSHAPQLDPVVQMAAYIGNLRSLAAAQDGVVETVVETPGERDLGHRIEESMPAGDDLLIRGDVILEDELKRRIDVLRSAIAFQPEPTLDAEFAAFKAIRESVHAIFPDLPLHSARRSARHSGIDPSAYEAPQPSGPDPFGAQARWQAISAAASGAGLLESAQLRGALEERVGLEVELQSAGIRLDGAALRAAGAPSTAELAPAVGSDSVIDLLVSEIDGSFTQALVHRVEIASLRHALPLAREELERLRGLEPPAEVVGGAVVERVEARGGERLWDALRPVQDQTAPPKDQRLRIVHERREEAAAAAAIALETLEYESRRPAYVNPDHDVWRSEIAYAERLIEMMSGLIDERSTELAETLRRARADAARLHEESLARRIRRTAALTGR